MDSHEIERNDEMEALNAMIFSTAASITVTGAAAATPASVWFPSIDAVKAALVSNGTPIGRFIDLPGISGPKRISLAMLGKAAGVGPANGNIDEDAYLLVPTSLGGVQGYRLKKVADLTWAVDILKTVPDASSTRAGLVQATQVAVAPTGMQLAATGFEVASCNGEPAEVVIYDRGPAVAYVGFIAPPAAGIGEASPTHQLWE